MNSQDNLERVASVPLNDALFKVAFATSDGDIVNQHFGSASGFDVYGISGSERRQIAHKRFGKEKQDGKEDKLRPKLAWLTGCDLVYCGSVGGSATRQLLALGIHPVIVKGEPKIDGLIDQLQRELKGTPSPLVARVMRLKSSRSESRFDSMAEETWDDG